MGRKQILIFGLVVFMVSAAVTFHVMAGETEIKVQISESELGKICVAGVYPSITRGVLRENSQPGENGITKKTDKEEGNVTIGGITGVQAKQPEEAAENIKNNKPLVIIYHTHATESYQPASEGNFHTLAEENTVREVGQVMTEELLKKGIQVIHDKTIHDSPSYNQSYSRAYGTITKLMAENPSAVYIVDLHRDAAAYAGNTGKTVIVNGETVAKYNLVVGKANPNVAALTEYANMLNAKAEEMYPGFGGRIIEKAYKFNEHVSDKYILLEIGNNQNQIREAKATAKYFAGVLEGVIRNNANKGS